MFFRRKKKPDSDQTVLTHALRSLQDLIEDPPQPSHTGPRAKPSDTGHADGHYNSPSTPPLVEPADLDAASGTQAARNGGIDTVDAEDDLPVLSNVVYMPIPRHAAATPQRQTHEPEPPPTAAQEAMAAQIIQSLEQHLETEARPLDAELARELHDAVRTSLADWSTRTLDILLKQLAEHEHQTTDRR